MKNILITICARGGSKGIPGKNIKLINNNPLITYSLAFAKSLQKKLKANTFIEISTDNEEIKMVANQYGHVTEYSRPTELATDFAGKISVLIHLLKYSEQKYLCEFDYLIDLDVTSPLRTLEDVLNAFDKINSNKDALNIFSVSKSHRNPYFNMVEENAEGFCHLSKSNKGILTRQSAPKVYDMNASFYIYRKEFFNQGFETAITDKSIIQLIEHTCFDLDEPVDFLFMEWLFIEKKLDFELIQP